MKRYSFIWLLCVLQGSFSVAYDSVDVDVSDPAEHDKIPLKLPNAGEKSREEEEGKKDTTGHDQKVSAVKSSDVSSVSGGLDFDPADEGKSQNDFSKEAVRRRLWSSQETDLYNVLLSIDVSGTVSLEEYEKVVSRLENVLHDSSTAVETINEILAAVHSSSRFQSIDLIGFLLEGNIKTGTKELQKKFEALQAKAQIFIRRLVNDGYKVTYKDVKALIAFDDVAVVRTAFTKNSLELTGKQIDDLLSQSLEVAMTEYQYKLLGVKSFSEAIALKNKNAEIKERGSWVANAKRKLSKDARLSVGSKMYHASTTMFTLVLQQAEVSSLSGLQAVKKVIDTKKSSTASVLKKEYEKFSTLLQEKIDVLTEAKNKVTVVNPLWQD